MQTLSHSAPLRWPSFYYFSCPLLLTLLFLFSVFSSDFFMIEPSIIYPKDRPPFFLIGREIPLCPTPDLLRFEFGWDNSVVDDVGTVYCVDGRHPFERFSAAFSLFAPFEVGEKNKVKVRSESKGLMLMRQQRRQNDHKIKEKTNELSGKKKGREKREEKEERKKKKRK